MPDARPSRVSYWGAPQTIQVMGKAVIDDAARFDTRRVVEAVCEGIDSKDYTSEYLAAYHFILQRTRYMRDPRITELVRAPWVTSGLLLAGRRPSLDCLPADTLLLTKDFRFVPIKDIGVGDQIWGRDRWSTVQATAHKGLLAVDHVQMNNGSTFAATSDHGVYVRYCEQHPQKWIDTDVGVCSCEQISTRRITVGELRPGMVLLQPDRIAFGEQEMDPDRAFIEGLYLSDGWHQDYAFCISGQDGCPKEEQKRQVVAACERLGIPTTWYRKFVYVADSEWAARLEQMGTHAPDKHALSIDLNEGSAGPLLRGIMADSGANTNGSGRTFTTTSYQLFLQTRVLHRMFAIGCGERFLSNHGGLGKNPIWRLQTRPERADGSRTKLLRVKNIERQVMQVPVCDIQTDDHYVYLPHADVTVSNCDDMITHLSSMLQQMGGKVEFVTAAFDHMFVDGRRQYSHVFLRVLEPRNHTWIVFDPVAAEKTSEMLGRIVAYDTWPITT